MAQIRIKNTATQPIDFSCQKDFTFFYSLTWFVTRRDDICQKLNDMKKLFFVLFVLMGLTTISYWSEIRNNPLSKAQWVVCDREIPFLGSSDPFLLLEMILTEGLQGRNIKIEFENEWIRKR